MRLLRERPVHRRRVVLLISETRDRSSKARIEDAITLAQHENVAIYPLTYSAFLTPFTAKANSLPPTSGPVGFNILAVLQEIARLANTDAAEAFSKYTGGRRYSFLKQRGLDQAVSRLGEELHSQYFLSFTPAPSEKEEFHQIRVEVPDRPNLTVRTRPGYWPVTAAP